MTLFLYNAMPVSRSIIFLSMFATSLLLTGCFTSQDVIEKDTGKTVSSIATSVAAKKAPEVPVPVTHEPVANVSCDAQSCGEDGNEPTCLKENGCICADGGCRQCKNKRETCTLSTECCSGLGMKCVSVTISTGATQKRCMPVLDNVCRVNCSDDGIWGAAHRCKNITAPDNIDYCDDLVGESCVPPTGGDRNERSCIR